MAGYYTHRSIWEMDAVKILCYRFMLMCERNGWFDCCLLAFLCLYLMDINGETQEAMWRGEWHSVKGRGWNQILHLCGAHSTRWAVRAPWCERCCRTFVYRPVSLQKVRFEENLKKVSCQALNGVIYGEDMDLFSILDIRTGMDTMSTHISSINYSVQSSHA